MTTDTAALQERIAHVTFEERYPGYSWESAPEYVKEAHRKRFASAMPIIAAEVRAAKAEAFDEGWKDRARRDVHRAYAFIDAKRNVPGPPASLNPYRADEYETGDRA